MPLRVILNALAESDGFGKITLRADESGALAHAATILHIKPTQGETIPSFLRRIQTQVRPGDDIEIAYERGVLQLARITRTAAAAAASG